MSAARIAALEARLVDVEKRHAEAIARLAMALEDLAAEQVIAAQRIHGSIGKAHGLVKALVGDEASDLVFEEWEQQSDEENAREFERLACGDPKKRERERDLEHKERARDRVTAAL